MFGRHPWGWVLRPISRYQREGISEGIVVDPIGMVHESLREVTVTADGIPIRASVLQQQNGLAQLLTNGAPQELGTIALAAA
jgi:hypothetical protein